MAGRGSLPRKIRELLGARVLPRSVIALGVASFANDVASEMVTPLIPLLLTVDLGAGPTAVGLVEGLAETAASLLKLWSGRLADRGVAARPLVAGGYGLSNAVRPLIGLCWAWPQVAAARLADRVGKGLRTSPRDALIARAVPEGVRGRAFGFHRAMDHAGAMLGPIAGFALLQAGWGVRRVVLASALPGLLVVAAVLRGVPAGSRLAPAGSTPAPLRWRLLDRRLKGLLVAAGGLALSSVPDAFVVLWAHEGGVRVAWVPLLWAAAHLVRAAVAYPAGRASDRFGRTPLLIGGWSARVAVLAAMPAMPPGPAVWIGFLIFAGTTALTEGAERALVGDRAPGRLRATAFGLYHLLHGMLALPGAVLFGLLWRAAGMALAFRAAALVTALSASAMLVAASGGERGSADGGIPQ
ncbi:MAG: MFS transporter [Acidobacteria bacterium]|nr:MAG: MFS transporter [Acidobacteriota bacterium]